MNRRHFLRNFATGAAALAFAPGLLRAEVAVASDSTRFARGLAEKPWLAGWKTIGREALGPTTAALDGRLPRDLAGVLYRNGPAWFERAGFRYKHWFDGDGMLHAWKIGHDGITHRARMVATPKFTREQSAGRFLMPAIGTQVPNALSFRNNDDLNTANTAVIRLNGRLFALWEGGSAFELNPDDLRTLGPVNWREDLVAAPFSAHPLIDRDGSLWNFGSLDMLGASGLLVWHIGANGQLIQITTLPSVAPGYLHSFAMTDRHLLFVLMPYQRKEDGTFFESLEFTTDQPCRIAVLSKDALEAPRWFEVEFGAVYHFGDAFEQKGEIVVHAARHRDPAAMRSPMAAAMRGEHGVEGRGAELVALRIDLAQGRARWESLGGHNVEFPTFDPRSPRSRPARLYAPTRIDPVHAPYANAIAAIDTGRARADVHCYGADIMAEEHIFVAKRGSKRPGQGWLVGTLLDHRRGRSGMVVLDAEHVDDGPLATAWLPHTMPLGFHGWFAAGG